jgi:hypothetical protein
MLLHGQEGKLVHIPRVAAKPRLLKRTTPCNCTDSFMIAILFVRVIHAKVLAEGLL